jgi:hypothetical protein
VSARATAEPVRTSQTIARPRTVDRQGRRRPVPDFPEASPRAAVAGQLSRAEPSWAQLEPSLGLG